MKIKGKLLSTVLALLMGFGVTAGLSFKDNTPKVEKDNITYSDESVVKYENPLRAGEDDADAVYAKSITIHYRNEDAKCDTRQFYVWVKTGSAYYLDPEVSEDGKEMSVTIDFSQPGYAEYLEEDYIFFIVKFRGTWSGQSEDILVSYAEYSPDANGHVEIWTIPGEGTSVEIYLTEEETKFDKVLTAKFMDWKTIHCEATAVPMSYALYAYDQTYFQKFVTEQQADKHLYLLKTGTPNSSNFDIVLNYTAHINVQYVVETVFATKPSITQLCNVGFEYLYGDPRFDTYYTYFGDDLGVTYTPTATTFKLWSPISANVNLKIYNVGTPKNLKDGNVEASNFCHEYKMAYTRGGVWQLTVEGDLHGKYYTFVVTNTNGTVETIDPYAKACGVNGVRGMIVDFDQTDPEGWDDIPLRWDGQGVYDIATPQDLSIYEIHIRDLTSDESWVGQSRRGTFSAFSEEGTTLTTTDTMGNNVTVTTGFDHIEEMNVNAIQLLPVFDHDDSEVLKFDENNEVTGTSMTFNWGYNPLNYNCIEGGYATDPYDGTSRITEYKQLIMDFANNANHTRTIMDVVYNHVSSAANHSWTKVMPKYYFRYDDNWNYYAGSGCANEVRTEDPMVRKYIVDSVKWWASEFKIKGFRFDLMGLIDTETMRACKDALYEIDPDIYIYGEGWTAAGYNGEAGTVGTFTENAYSMLYPSLESPGLLGAFNDNGRNAIKGENWAGNIYQFNGFISNGSHADRLLNMFIGDHPGKGANPMQTINYASCHDNYTLFDQLSLTVGANQQDSRYPAITCEAVASVEAAILMSNGVAFIQGGEEIFRTKEVTEERDLAAILNYDDEDKPYYKDTHVIGGKLISHNSYNLSDTTNSFKWERKVKIGNTPTLKYCEAIADAAEARKHLTRYTWDDISAWNAQGLQNHERPMNAWTNGGVVGYRNNNYYFIINSTSSTEFYFDAITYCDNVFMTDPYRGYSKSGTGVTLNWGTAICVKDRR